MRYILGVFVVIFGLAACGADTDPTAAYEAAASQKKNDDIPILDDAPLDKSALKTASMSDAEKAAMDLFAYQEGEWNSTWTWYGDDGEVVNTMTGTETFSYLTDTHSQMLTNVVPAIKQTSYAMLAFNPAQQHIIFLNIGPKGDYWIMRLNPLTGVMISEPHLNADGSEVILMFTTVQKTADMMDIEMETSIDGGESWAKGYTQTLTRKIYDSDGE